MLWMVKPEIAQRYERAMREGIQPTAAQIERFTVARSRSSGQEGPECLTIAGDVAQIAVDGVLTPQPDWLVWYLFGNTAYSEIREALAAASTNPDVKRVQWMFSSPGGMVDGFFDLLPAIETFSKPSDVLASLACSAAFGLASLAGKITATSPGAEFGSVGVCRTYFVDGPGAMERSIDVTSTEAPNKRPDVTTPEGLAVVKRELDVQHDLLVDAIARGRSRHTGSRVTKAQVNANFGRGGSVYAEDAVEAGMIDRAPPRKPRGATAVGEAQSEAAGAQPSVAAATIPPEPAPEPVQKPAPAGAPTNKAKAMTTITKAELQTNHPEIYAAIVAEGHATGVTAGETKERKRVSALLKLGKSSGSMETAEKAIASGASPQDDEVFSEFQAASMNRRDQKARQQDSDDADAATVNADKPKVATKDLGDRMADMAGLPPDPAQSPKK
jgi:ClpP class serine protease